MPAFNTTHIHSELCMLLQIVHQHSTTTVALLATELAVGRTKILFSYKHERDSPLLQIGGAF